MRALLYETVTGNPVTDLELITWSYDTGILAHDALTLQIPAYTPAARKTRLQELLIPFKYSIALIDNTVTGQMHVPAAGYISTAPAVENSDGLHVYNIRCVGVDKLFQYRHIRKHPGTPLTFAPGRINETLDVRIENVEYGTLIKKLVQETLKFPGGTLPINFEPDRPGNKARTYKAIDGKPVLDAIEDITQLVGGIEYDFMPQIDPVTEQISHNFITGTDTTRTITHNHHTLTLGGSKSQIDNFEHAPIPATAVTHAIYTGGKQQDTVITAEHTDTTLTSQGFPTLELWNSEHSSVSEPETLKKYATAAVGNMSTKTSFRTRHTHHIRHGDTITLNTLNHWHIPDGNHTRRVLSIERSSTTPQWTNIRLVDR